MTPEIVKQLYAEFYTGAAGTASAEASSHWKEFSRHSNVQADEEGNITVIKGYGFGGSDDSRLVARLIAAAGNRLTLWSLPYKGLAADIRKARKTVIEMGLFFYQDAFRQACTRFFLAEKIKQQKLPVQNILIIGDGFGVLAALLKKQYPGANIFLIDLGVTLFFQSYYLGRAFPEKKHVLIEKDSVQQQEGDFYYCPAERVNTFPDIQIDLAVNIASMQEMDPAMIATYFSLLRSRNTKLFYCCNRLEKKLPDGTIVRMFEYPWKTEDVFVTDEECPWHRFFVGRVGGSNVKLMSIIPVPFMRRYDGIHWHRLAKLTS